MLNVGSAHLGEFGSREVIGAGQGRDRRGPRPRRPGRAQRRRPDRRRRWPRAPRPGRHLRRQPGRRRARRRAHPRRLGPGRLHAAHAVRGRDGPDGHGRRAHGRQRVRRGCRRAALRDDPGPRSPSCSARRSRAAGGGWRSPRRPSGVTVVNDAYNANPESMRAALRSLAAMRGQGRTIAVLGEMRELGADSIAEHDEVGRLAVRLDISKTIAVGQGARALYLGAAQEGSWNEEAVFVPDVDAAIELAARPGPTRRRRAGQGLPIDRPRGRGRRRSWRTPHDPDRPERHDRPGPGRCSARPLLIKVLSRRNLAQAIRESGDGIVYPEHSGKRGTPSMGGLAIVAAVVLGYGGAHLLRWTVAHGLGAARPLPDGGAGPGGLRRRLPQGLQVAQRRDPRPDQAARPGGRGAELRLPGHAVPRRRRASRRPPQAISVVRDLPWVLPLGLFLLWIWFLVTAITNGVNLTDGLDGLAAGASVLTFGGFTLIGVWQYGQSCSYQVDQRLLHGARPAGPRRRSPWPAPGPPSGSCGGTPARRRSSWATPAAWPSAGRWRPWRS